MDSNGYFSLNISYNYSTLPSIPFKPSKKIIAPFALDYDTTDFGDVFYIFDTNGSLLTNASEFIRQNSGNTRFDGNYGILVEWKGVRRQGSTEVSQLMLFLVIII